MTPDDQQAVVQTVGAWLSTLDELGPNLEMNP